MDDFNNWHKDLLGEKVAQALTKNNFKAIYVKTRDEAVREALKLIEPNATIGVGGSATVKELGLPDMLEGQGHVVFDHGKPGLSREEVLEMRRKQLTSDVFLTGTNAITLDGKLVNVDASGNRVAAMIFGPKKVIIIAGVNKIVDNVEAAERRIQLYAAPINNKRLNRQNPCIATGVCMDCQSASRICNITTVIHKKPSVTDATVIIVGEQMGY